jgi:hypothetical protein
MLTASAGVCNLMTKYIFPHYDELARLRQLLNGQHVINRPHLTPTICEMIAVTEARL